MGNLFVFPIITVLYNTAMKAVPGPYISAHVFAYTTIFCAHFVILLLIGLVGIYLSAVKTMSSSIVVFKKFSQITII